MKQKTEARLKGTLLTVGFHTAKAPLIWRFDLEQNHSFSLALRAVGEDWELGMTTAKGDFSPIAVFEDRDSAQEALMRVEKALSKKGGPTALLFRAAGIITLIASVLALLAILSVLGIHYWGWWMNGAPTQTAAPQAPVMREGAPMSADEVLQAPTQ